jgi:hypothetical protein
MNINVKLEHDIMHDYSISRELNDFKVFLFRENIFKHLSALDRNLYVVTAIRDQYRQK